MARKRYKRFNSKERLYEYLALTGGIDPQSGRFEDRVLVNGTVHYIIECQNPYLAGYPNNVLIGTKKGSYSERYNTLTMEVSHIC